MSRNEKRQEWYSKVRKRGDNIRGWQEKRSIVMTHHVPAHTHRYRPEEHNCAHHHCLRVGQSGSYSGLPRHTVHGCTPWCHIMGRELLKHNIGGSRAEGPVAGSDRPVINEGPGS